MDIFSVVSKTRLWILSGSSSLIELPKNTAMPQRVINYSRCLIMLLCARLICIVFNAQNCPAGRYYNFHFRLRKLRLRKVIRLSKWWNWDLTKVCLTPKLIFPPVDHISKWPQSVSVDFYLFG